MPKNSQNTDTSAQTVMNRQEFYQFCRRISFPEEACSALCGDLDRLLAYAPSADLLKDSVRRFSKGEKLPFYLLTEELCKMKEQTGVHPYSSDMIFYLYLAPVLEVLYAQRGLPAKWFDGAMEDLLCKLNECREVYGIWGSFVAVWFSRFYNFTLYAMGRLEFCLINSPFDYEKDRLSIKKGQKCIDVHIPSKGRLDREELAASYKEAAEYFAPMLDAPVAFHCESWLLFEHHKEMLPESSGIRRFADDYSYMCKAPDEGDLWRIFGGEDTDNPEKLSEKTSLQRAYKRWLLEGNPCYGGEGIFFYDHFKK